MTGLVFPLPIPEELIELLARRAAELLRSRRRFLSKEALADHLGVSTRTIKSWRERGLPGRKVGRTVMFELSEVEAWIDREGR
jgi:excisionase family DNA binding protein